MKNWNGKPYHSLDYMLRETFGEKVYKVTLTGDVFSAVRVEAVILRQMRH